MSEGEGCHVGVMVKWKVKLWSSIFKRGTSENKRPSVSDHNRRETDMNRSGHVFT